MREEGRVLIGDAEVGVVKCLEVWPTEGAVDEKSSHAEMTNRL